MNDRRVRKKARSSNTLKMLLFFLSLIFFMVFSFLLPLRPKTSLVEKRELAEFPSFSVSALATGEYFEDIDTWFSDTYPQKDSFVKINAWVKNLYGFGNTVHGTVEKGDEIPDVPKK
ncbi:MAG: DHHW family protein [Oscillospiraceae bacterium]